MITRSLAPALTALALVLSACGGEPPPVETPKPPTPAEPAPVVEAPAATAEPAAPPPAPAEPVAEEPARKTPPPSGRPPVLKSDPEEITDTFGLTPAAKLELGDDKGRAVLRIPEYAFDRGVNVTFKIDKKGKTAGGQIGKIYHTLAQVAGATEFRTIQTQGPPFVLELPAGNKKNANLAIGDILVGEAGREKVTWRVVAPSKIDDVAGIAIFELPSLGDCYLHVTTKEPTVDKAAPAKN
jgi:hypothetical protein